METTFAPKISLTKDTNAHYDVDNETLVVGDGSAAISETTHQVESHEKAASDMEEAGRRALKNQGGEDTKVKLDSQPREAKNVPPGPWNIDIGEVVGGMVGGAIATNAREPRPEMAEAFSAVTGAMVAGETPTPEQLEALASEVEYQIAPMFGEKASPHTVKLAASLITAALVQEVARRIDQGIRNIR